MPGLYPFDYAVIRVVPRVERDEFINAGVIVSCPARNFLKAKIELDTARWRRSNPSLIAATIPETPDAIPLICEGGKRAGPIGLLAPRSRFHWLVAPRSTIIQTSPSQQVYATTAMRCWKHLLDRMVRQRDPDR